MTARCKRCDLPVKVDPKPGSKARMLKRGKTTAGYCVHCAVHDWLRNTYPTNLQLAESGPRILLNEGICKQFANLMRAGGADAFPDEINWNRIVEFWELPFCEPVKPTAMNPVTQKELDEVASGQRPGLGGRVNEAANLPRDPLGGTMTIGSFGDLNSLEPGLGDDLRAALRKTLDKEAEGRDGCWKQKRLFED